MSENQPKQNQPRAGRLGPVAGVGRRVQVAGFVIVALLAGVGYGYASPAATNSAGPSAQNATTSPVNSAEVVCPVVKDVGNTNVTTFTPTTVTGTGTAGETVTQLTAGSGQPKPILTAGKPGTLASATGLNGDSVSANDVSNPVVARVTGPDAPGFTMTESLPSTGGGAQSGEASVNCVSPDTDFWFTGLGTDKNPFALLNLVNADAVPASVTITVFTGSGPLTGANVTALQGVTLTAGSQAYELISSLAANQSAPYAVHVVATVGRVAAGVLDYDGQGGGRDFIGAQKAAGTLVMPGIPQAEDNEKIELSLLAPNAPASVALRWVGQSTIAPATGSFTGELDQGKVTTVDLSTVANAGEYATLEVCGASSSANQCLPVNGQNGAPGQIVGEVKVTQSDKNGQDTAYITPVGALSGDGVVADNPPDSVLTLSNTGSAPATVKVTQIPSGSSPTPVVSTVTVKPGVTVAQPLSTPQGANGYALVVSPVGGTVYAARIAGTGHLLTIQPLSSAAETVTIPAVGQDVSGLVPQN